MQARLAPVPATLRWLLPALIPTLLATIGVFLTDRRREPIVPVIGTFLLGMLTAAVAFFIEARAAAWTGLDVRSSVAGDSGAMLFLFGMVAPVREAAKVAACWPAFRSRHFDEPYDGVVYAAVASMGFAAVETALILRAHPVGALWIARTSLALLAHLFFASTWGYALGRAKRMKHPGPMFPMAWLAATIGHALYAHFVYGRGPSGLIGILPMLLIMGVVSFFAARDLRARSDRAERGDRPPRSDGDVDSGNPLARASMPPSNSAPPSLRAMREALRRADHPLMVRWIIYGAVVTMGAMIAGFAASVAFGNWAHVDFATVDEHDVSTTGPVALLGSGILAAFPVSGFLVARASSLPTLLEPALGTALAITTSLVILGLAAPVAMVFALAFSPIALGLACAGAWVGRPSHHR
jgi:RsiW-degrading membrane proteinase PrsW (M82 family)